MSLVKQQRRRPNLHNLQGELGKVMQLIFIGEHKRGKDVESWLLEMRMYL